MDNFNLKQYLFESRVGMYSRAILKENVLMDAEALGMEIAKQHPELIDFKLNINRYYNSCLHHIFNIF